MNTFETSGDTAATPQSPGDARLLPLVMSLFFAFGFCTVLVDTLTPKLKAMFSLNHAEANLTQFCFFIAYFIVSIPAGWLLTRIGYLKGVVLGLVIMAAGCLMFTPAARIGVYSGFLVALFVLASGITIVQVAANPLAAGGGRSAPVAQPPDPGAGVQFAGHHDRADLRRLLHPVARGWRAPIRTPAPPR